MFSKVFDLVFAALNKNFKNGLIAILVTACVVLLFNEDSKAKKAQDDCADDKARDRVEIDRLRNQINEYTQTLQDFAFGKLNTERKALENDSVIRKSVNKDINNVTMP